VSCSCCNNSPFCSHSWCNEFIVFQDIHSQITGTCALTPPVLAFMCTVILLLYFCSDINAMNSLTVDWCWYRREGASVSAAARTGPLLASDSNSRAVMTFTLSALDENSWRSASSQSLALTA
jgi:hypothetical protein